MLGHLKAGEYRFDRPMSARDALAKIARGEVDLVNVTFREGLTIAEMAAIFEAQGLGSAASFREAASNATLGATWIVRPRTSKGTCSRKPTPFRATSCRSNSFAPWWIVSRTS
jgi:cell division protein YceG involved in septum cleavage